MIESNVFLMLWRWLMFAATPLYFHSENKSKNSNPVDNSVKTTDKRLVTDGNSVGVSADSSTVTVNTSDMGAIAAAFDFAKNGSKTISDQLTKVTDVIGDTISFAEATAQMNQDQKDALTGTRQLAVVGMIVAALAGFAALKGGKIKL